MPKTTFWDVILRTLEKAGKPLSAKGIWEQADKLGTLGDFTTTGKTPWDTIAAYCYTDINKFGEQSTIYQVSTRPALFYLRKLKNQLHQIELIDETETESKSPAKTVKSKFGERDLHPLLATYLSGNNHFRAYVKTIFHEVSGKTTKGKNEWLHPDLVGVYFPFNNYKSETLELQKHLSVTSIRLFSFEMKIELNFGNLRESYFQAVSNSSWANEGYLVALKVNEDPSFGEELRRLSNAFGIGVIQLNAANIHESQILFPARSKSEIDWDTVNRLVTENKDFQNFMKSVSDDNKIGSVKSVYDAVLTDEQLIELVNTKAIG